MFFFYSAYWHGLIEESESHIVVSGVFRGGFFLGFLLKSLFRNYIQKTNMIVIRIFSDFNLGCVLSSSSGGGSASSGWARSDTASDVRNELGDINVLESTSEKTGPEGLTVDLGRLN